MKTTLGWFLILSPLLLLIMAYHEGGVFGVFMYIMYMGFAAFTILAPKKGREILRKNNENNAHKYS